MNADFRPYHLTLELSGIPLAVPLEYKESYDFFKPYSREESAPVVKVAVSESDWQAAEKRGLPRCGQIEISLLTAKASDCFLVYDRAIMHAAAIFCYGKSWLIAGPPRAGKSTQVKYLTELYPDEFSIICGDRPILQLADETTVIVHPSPWNGKEGWRGAEAAPLAGILCLERGAATSIRRLDSREAAAPLFSALISMREDAETIHRLAAFETAMIKAAPVYEYINGGVPDSTKILYQFLNERTHPE